MVAYKVYGTSFNKINPVKIEDLPVFELSLSLIPEMLWEDGWGHTYIRLINQTNNTVFFEYRVKHPQDYHINDDNWYIYLKGIIDNLSTQNIPIMARDVKDPTAQKAILFSSEHIVGCTFIQCDSQDSNLVILVKPDVQIDNDNEFDISNALRVFDHDYPVDIEDIIYTKGIDKIYVSLKPTDDIPDGARYYIGDSKKDTPADLLKNWLFDAVDLTFVEANHSPEELANPYRLEGKTIGDFKYLESVDKRIKVAVGYKNSTPYDLPVTLAEKIGASSLNDDTKDYLYDELGEVLKQAIDLFKAGGFIAVTKAFVYFNDRVDCCIAGVVQISFLSVKP